MITSISLSELSSTLIRQLESHWEINRSEKRLINEKIGGVILRCEHCFRKTPNKYYSLNGEPIFNHLQSAQYTIFLYFFSNTLSEIGNKILADKIYYLNKIMNGCDLYHEIKLPRFFMLDHPVGSVMGRAEYGEGFVFSQNCTVGNNNGIYPIIGENVRLCAYSSIIGNCHIGDNVTLGAGTMIKDTDIPSNSLVFGQSPFLIIKQKNE